ncbi:YjfB family protein [Campylobacter sp. US33a]|uniref:YjfB family protein n=1 Tax=Campylobacter sp. CCS1377 TaxID=3158229 RepID=A0AAU7E9Q7_9BACT|nr:YjfB family protein [Campylobacter sp. US33a]TEY03155.1 putative motility protein [Campylobacter sp. US33a]
MIPDMSNASLMVAVNTSVFKKAMDANEAAMAQLLEGLTSGTNTSSTPAVSSSANSGGIDIYA